MRKDTVSREITTQSLYPSGMLEETLGRLRYVAEHQLFAVLTGECAPEKPLWCVSSKKAWMKTALPCFT